MLPGRGTHTQFTRHPRPLQHGRLHRIQHRHISQEYSPTVYTSQQHLTVHHLRLILAPTAFTGHSVALEATDELDTNYISTIDKIIFDSKLLGRYF